MRLSYLLTLRCVAALPLTSGGVLFWTATAPISNHNS
jgi:hypothetical protein